MVPAGNRHFVAAKNQSAGRTIGCGRLVRHDVPRNLVRLSAPAMAKGPRDRWNWKRYSSFIFPRAESIRRPAA